MDFLRLCKKYVLTLIHIVTKLATVNSHIKQFPYIYIALNTGHLHELNGCDSLCLSTCMYIPICACAYSFMFAFPSCKRKNANSTYFLYYLFYLCSHAGKHPPCGRQEWVAGNPIPGIPRSAGRPSAATSLRSHLSTSPLAGPSVSSSAPIPTVSEFWHTVKSAVLQNDSRELRARLCVYVCVCVPACARARVL